MGYERNSHVEDIPPGKVTKEVSHALYVFNLSRFNDKSRCYIRLNRESVPSRAYISFKTVEQVAVFSQQYDGHMFRDKQGAMNNDRSYLLNIHSRRF